MMNTFNNKVNSLANSAFARFTSKFSTTQIFMILAVDIMILFYAVVKIFSFSESLKTSWVDFSFVVGLAVYIAFSLTSWFGLYSYIKNRKDYEDEDGYDEYEDEDVDSEDVEVEESEPQANNKQSQMFTSPTKTNNVTNYQEDGITATDVIVGAMVYEAMSSNTDENTFEVYTDGDNSGDSDYSSPDYDSSSYDSGGSFD